MHVYVCVRTRTGFPIEHNNNAIVYFLKYLKVNGSNATSVMLIVVTQKLRKRQEQEMNLDQVK